jgi:hypothetical protein
MSTLLYGMYRESVPPEENVVRATTAVVEKDAPPAEAAGPPEWNERETDPNPDLGMVNRQVASDWHASEKYAPSWAATANPTSSFTYINERQDRVGTAAAREMAGEFGHGTMAYAIGIEPTLRDGAAFGADYFAVDERGAQETAGLYMQAAPGLDRDAVTAAAAAAESNSRDATAASVYKQWYAATIGG